MRKEKMKKMEKNKNNKYLPLFIIVIAVLMTLDTGVSQAGIFGQSDRQALKKRTEKYWNSKLTGDMITCYQLEEAKFRKRVPVSVYSRTGTLMYKSVKIKDVETEDDNGTVTVEIKYFIPALGSKHIFTTKVKDKWRKIQGTWYHVPEENGLKGIKKPKRKGGDGKEGK